MTESSKNRKFLGSGWCFPPEFQKNTSSPGVKMVTEEDDIRESLNILLSTRPGERIMRPSYGCGLQLLVFEMISESLITEIKDVIERAILFFETRISIKNIDVDVKDAYEGQIMIQLIILFEKQTPEAT